MREQDEKFRNLLQERVREQNLIHELVVINQVLVEASERLGEQVKEIPLLKQQVKHLQMELSGTRASLSSPIDDSSERSRMFSDRIEKSRAEAALQRQCGIFSVQYEKGCFSVEKSDFDGLEKQLSFKANKTKY